MDRLLSLMGLYWQVLSDERQERQKLLVRVGEMQKTMQDLVKRHDRLLDDARKSSMSRTDKSTTTTTKPLPRQTQRASSIPIAIRSKSRKEGKKSRQQPSFSQEIFEGTGIKLPFKGKALRVRLPKPPPVTSNPTADRPPYYKPLPSPPLPSTTEKYSNGVLAFSVRASTLNDDKPKAPAFQNLFTADDCSEFPKAMDRVDMSASRGGSTSVFSFKSDLIPAVSNKPPKFDFTAPLAVKNIDFNFKPMNSTVTPPPQVDMSLGRASFTTDLLDPALSSKWPKVVDLATSPALKAVAFRSRCKDPDCICIELATPVPPAPTPAKFKFIFSATPPSYAKGKDLDPCSFNFDFVPRGSNPDQTPNFPVPSARVRAGRIYAKKHAWLSRAGLPGQFWGPHALVVGEATPETKEKEEEEEEDGLENMLIKCRRLLSFTPEGTAKFIEY